MTTSRIQVKNISKQYKLGEVGTGTFSHDLNRFWHKIRGKEDPYKQLTESNDRTIKTANDYVWAIKDINFSVNKGEVLGIIGKNGAGKSSLLKILSKVTGPTTGKITINGRIGALLEVGTGMHPELTGRENIFLNGAILGMTKKEIKSKINEIIDFAGIAKYIDTPFKRYSSGMRVRLGFAVAAFLEPEILIVDEVLAVGDAEFQKKAIGKMQDISSGNARTVLFVSHNMSSISTLTNRCLVIDKGEIIFDGKTSEAIATYQKLNTSTNIYICSEKIKKEVYINKIEVTTSLPNGLHEQGKELKIKFEIFNSKPVKNAALSFQIFNELNNPCVHQWYYGTENDFLEKGGTHELICTIPNLKLYQGNYSISVFLAQFGGETFEKIHEVCSFEVSMINQKRDYPWQKQQLCLYGKLIMEKKQSLI